MAKKKTESKQKPKWVKYSWWAIPLLAVLVYIPSFTGEFTLDDNLIVENNELITSLNKIPQIWASHYWAGKIDASDKSLYRPLTLTTYALQYVLHKENPIPYHILNILLHALACFVFLKMIDLVFKDYRLTILAGVLFAIHPIHTEAVSSIVGRAEILAALFILSACICYHHWRQNGGIKWLIGLLLSTMAAITSKEHGFMLPMILALQETIYFFNDRKYQWLPKRVWPGLISVILVSLILWGIRSTITGPPVPHEQWLGVGSLNRIATSIRTSAEYVILHLWPLKLSADYWTDEVPIVGFGNIRVILSLVFLMTLFAIAIWQRKKMPPFSWGILFFLLTLLPVSNFLFAAGFLKAERILYIPSIGIIVALAFVLIKLSEIPKGKMVAIGLAVVFILFFMGRTWVRAGDWKNNYSLAFSSLKTSPDSPRLNNMMGLELSHLKRNKEALLYFEKAVRSNPNHVPALINLGLEYKGLNRLQDAAATLEKALSIDPSLYPTYVNLMTVYRALGDYDRNLIVAQKALDRFPGSAPILWNAANAYQLKNDMQKAIELRAKAREIQPGIGGN